MDDALVASLTLQTWLLFCATETVLCFTPGPAVLLVISLSLTRGARAGFRGSLGILAANAGYFVLSATSLGAVLLASWNLFVIIKWLGAAYLVWLGVPMILFPTRFTSIVDPSPGSTLGRGPATFWHGVAIQVAILGISSVLIEFVVLGLYVAACHRARGWAENPRVAMPLQRAGGVLLVGAGARIAAIRHA
ncbi:MAG: hypothetical protein DMF96_06330 [Acidobacteria bacterium]|nr:MAG: hypothetical protein DMF96_06330 [Acidobacteriota bacterium]